MAYVSAPHADLLPTLQLSMNSQRPRTHLPLHLLPVPLLRPLLLHSRQPLSHRLGPHTSDTGSLM